MISELERCKLCGAPLHRVRMWRELGGYEGRVSINLHLAVTCPRCGGKRRIWWSASPLGLGVSDEGDGFIIACPAEDGRWSSCCA